MSKIIRRRRKLPRARFYNGQRVKTATEYNVDILKEKNIEEKKDEKVREIFYNAVIYSLKKKEKEEEKEEECEQFKNKKCCKCDNEREDIFCSMCKICYFKSYNNGIIYMPQGEYDLEGDVTKTLNNMNVPLEQHKDIIENMKIDTEEYNTRKNICDCVGLNMCGYCYDKNVDGDSINESESESDGYCKDGHDFKGGKHRNGKKICCSCDYDTDCSSCDSDDY